MSLTRRLAALEDVVSPARRIHVIAAFSREEADDKESTYRHETHVGPRDPFVRVIFGCNDPIERHAQ